MKFGTLTIVDRKFQIDAAPHVSILLQRVFGGAQRAKAGRFTLSTSPKIAHELEWFRSRYPLEIDPEAEPEYRRLAAEHERTLAAIAHMDAPDYVPPEIDLAIPLRAYQRADADLAIRTGALLIASEIGSGKTCSCIGVLSSPGSLPAVVVVLKHLARQWERELARFAPKLRVHRIKSGRPYDFPTTSRVEADPLTRRRRVVHHTGMPDVLIITYTMINGWVEALQGRVRTFVADEAQDFRHRTSDKYKAGYALRTTCDRAVFATATPIYNYGNEIFSVMDMLSPGCLGTWEEFLKEWCGAADQRGRAVVHDPAALGTFLRESGLMVRRTRKEIGREIPPLSVVRMEVEADAEYINRASDDVAELARRIVNRLGSPTERRDAARDIDFMMRQATGIAKAGAVAEFVRLLVESGERVLLSGWHRAVYDLWRDAFTKANVPFAMYTGSESEAAKDKARLSFIDGEAMVMIISNRSGAGLDGLQHVCRTVVAGELDWSPQVLSQLFGRAARDGQKDPVTAYVMVTDSGADPPMEQALGLKGAQSHYFLNPEAAGEEMPEFAGVDTDRIRQLAESVLAQRGRA